MNMVDGVLLLVDAVEGPMPQTRFVLRQALEKGHKAIVVVNKIDRPAARPDYAVNATFDLFIELGATDEQADFPVIYTRALEGKAGFTPNDLADNLYPLFETIVKHIPPPVIDPDAPARLLITNMEYSAYVGKIAIGRLSSGTFTAGQPVVHINTQGEVAPGKITQVYIFRNLKREERDKVDAGTIMALAGIPNIGIGDTIAHPDDPRPLPPIKVEEPTVRMTFSINNAPFAGLEGQYVTSRQVRERLWKELENNVAMRVEETDSADRFIVSGRGELHLAILIETMRREGYEFSVSKPEVILKETENGLEEPIEHVFIEVAGDQVGAVTEMMGRRKGSMLDMRYGEDSTVYLEYLVPTQGMLGFQQRFVMITRGTGIVHTLFHSYQPYQGQISHREHGSLVALETGMVTTYALTNLQQRGIMFIKPGDEVYAGQVVGQYIKNGDLVVNVCKTKHLTNVRKSFSDITVGLTPAKIMSLDEIIEYLGADELLEVTPQSLRIRKKELNHHTRQKTAKREKKL
jgi:GTP-binding protein